MIRIAIKLSGPLRNYYLASKSAKQEIAELSSMTTVADLLDYYNIAHESVHLVLVNRRKAELTTLLKDGDEVWALPLAAGG